MHNNDNIYETIEQYLEGSLPEGQKMLFEQQLQTDEGLKQKVLVCKSTQGLIMQNKLKDLKSLMSTEKAKVEKSEILKKAGLTLLGSVLLVTGGVWYLQKEKTKQKEVQQEIGTDQKQSVLPMSQKPTVHTQEENLASKPEVKSPDVQKPVAEPKTSTSTQKTASVNPNSIITAPLVGSEKEKDQLQPAEKNKEESNVNTDKTLDPCKGIVITADIEVLPPCKSLSSTGTINLRGPHGGQAPYRVSLNGKDMGTEDSYPQLAEGSYQVIVTDAKGCKQTFNPVLLKAKECQMDYDFNPNRGEEWLGPMLTSAAKLSILDKKGMLVYSKQVQAGESCTWSGYSQSGNLVSGYFVFVLEKADGSVAKGSITVTE